MGRRNLSASDRIARSNPVVTDVWRTPYIHPGGYTSNPDMLVDRSARFIAIPPVTSSVSSQGFPVAAATANLRPSHVMLYRDDHWFLRFDAVAETAGAGYIPGGQMLTMPINPGAATLSAVALEGTSPLIFSWVNGD